MARSTNREAAVGNSRWYCHVCEGETDTVSEVIAAGVTNPHWPNNWPARQFVRRSTRQSGDRYTYMVGLPQ